MDLINQLLPKLEEFRLLGYFFVFLISFLESLAFIGIFIPGTVFLVLIGFIASNGVWDIGMIFLFAMAGATLADFVSFYLGSHGKIFFTPKNKIFKISYLEHGEKFFENHGNKSVFIGRFIGPIRPIIPFVAGLVRMNRIKFFFYNFLSAVIWSAFYLALGYFFGATAGEFLHFWSAKIRILALIVALILGGIYLLRRYLK